MREALPVPADTSSNDGATLTELNTLPLGMDKKRIDG